MLYHSTPCRQPPVSVLATTKDGGLWPSHYPLGYPMLYAPGKKTARFSRNSIIEKWDWNILNRLVKIKK
jgi:hypothetical protein